MQNANDSNARSMRNVSLLRMDGKQTEKYGRHLSIQIQNTLNELINWSELLNGQQMILDGMRSIHSHQYIICASADRKWWFFPVIFNAIETVCMYECYKTNYQNTNTHTHESMMTTIFPDIRVLFILYNMSCPGLSCPIEPY